MRTSPRKRAAELLAERARRRLEHFTTFTYPQYRVEPVHALIASTLDGIVAGSIKRLMIFAPPQNGKSELASVRLPAFWLGNRPEDPVIVASYAASLAESKSRQVRQNVEGPEFAALFPGITTAQDSRAVNHWQIDGHRGGLLAVGVGGPITGHGAMLGIIDDPFENWAQSQSLTIRNNVWDWYRTTFRTRIWEGGAITLIMCMTGDTPVLMATGQEKPLNDIRPGDRVATYEGGRISVSTVVNWRNNGPDSVYAIRMKSGIIVKANARHPFLAEEDGETRWQRTATLKKGSVILRVIGASGGASPALSRGAASQSSAKGCASLTTTSSDGELVFARLRSILSRGVRLACATVTESARRSMIAFWPSRAGSAQSASSPRQPRTSGRIGVAFSASTTTTPAERSEGFSATTVTSPSGTASQRTSSRPLLSTCEVVRDTVVEVAPCGVEDVFDIQVERTENFIAGGLVSHNTRWHEDDLAGRLLAEQASEWTVLRLPAVAETQQERDNHNVKMGLAAGQPDPLGREPGEPLSPGRYSSGELARLKRDVGSLAWAAEYQGSPTLPEGYLFKRQWFSLVEAAPVNARRVRYWDKAGTAGGGAQTAGVLMARDESGLFYVEDVVRGQWSAHERNQVTLQTTQVDAARYSNAVTVWTEQEPGSGGKESAEATIRSLAGYPVFAETVTGAKEVRWEPFRSQCEAGNVKMVRGAWNAAYLEEMAALPNGTYKDQADASAGAFAKLAQGGAGHRSRSRA